MRLCAVANALLIAVIALPASAEETMPNDHDLSERVRAAVAETVAEHKVPGAWAAIADAQGGVAIGSAGVRKAGDKTPVADDDLVHIGSCTKAMTSTLLAILIRDGQLTWETTLAEGLPDLADEIHQSYHGVTLWQLVTHTGGLRPNAKDWWSHDDLELRERRLRQIKDNLSKPATQRGKHVYSNFGYLVAGCLAEEAADATWEQLLRRRLFQPLGMTAVGFGPPGTAEDVDQPKGHVWRLTGWSSRHHDNAAALGPAGRVHVSLADWAKFTALQLTRDDTRLLSRAELDHLLTVEANDYAAGWIVVQRPWAGGTALNHAGSNTMWYANVWLAPAKQRAYFAATNSCGLHSHGVTDELIVKLIAIDQQN